MLAAGIDVFSHRQRPAPRVAQRPGGRADRRASVRETVPDEELAKADEVVLDRPPAGGPDRPPAGRQGLRRGRGSRPRSTASSASRTCARCARSRCARWPRRSRTRRVDAPPIAERLLAFVSLDERDERVVRRAWRSAQRLSGELDVLVVRRPGEPRAEQRAAPGGAAAPGRDARRAPARRGRATSSTVLTRVARERGTTYILLGPPPRRRFSEPLLLRILRALPDVDVRVVAQR